MVVEHPAEGLHALRQALGIVHAVDADDQRAVVDDAAEALGGGVALLALGERGDVVGVDADGEGAVATVRSKTRSVPSSWGMPPRCSTR